MNFSPPLLQAFSPDAQAKALDAVKGDEAIANLGEKQLKQLVMPFAKFKIEEVAKGGAQVRADPGRGDDVANQGRILASWS